MAVPDWPTTFGINMFLYNFLNAAWGVFIEHGHRLYGSAVGLCLLIVAPWMQCMRKLPYQFKIAAWVALIGVIVQGVMGGYRVRLNSSQLAMIHGCFGQLFFLYLACLATWSGKTWRELGTDETSQPAGKISSSLLYMSLLVTVLLYVQIVIGAWLRHFQAPLKLYLHEVVGVAAVVLSTVLAAKVRKSGMARSRSIRRVRSLFVSLVHVQLILGFASWWLMRPFDGIPKFVTDAQAIVRTLHQANGALVLAFSGILSMWIVRACSAERSDVIETQPVKEAACLS